MIDQARRHKVVATAVSAAAVLFLSVACSVREPAVYADKTVSRGEEVLASVKDVEITEQEVAELMAPQLLRVDRERRQIMQQGLERLAAERLIELESNRLGVSAEELLAAEVESKVVDPTVEEVDAFYEQQKNRIRRPKEEVTDQIRDHLRQQSRRAIYAQLVAELKEKHGYQAYLEPFRVAVEADGFPAKGPENAPVTIVEFSDFECPYCASVVPTLERVLERYPDQVRLVFRQFPLSNIHANAQKAAEASLCAREQESFWEMHDAMFKEQRSLGVEQLKEKAARLGLRTDDFNECLDSSRYTEEVAADLTAGGRIGVTGTPAVFINGRFLSGAQPFEEIVKVIDDELAAGADS